MATDATPSGPSRGKTKYLYLLAVVVLVAAGWSGAWAYGRSVVSDQIDLQLRQMAGGGLDISCEDLSIAGYPFRYEIRCRNLRSLDRSGIESAMGTLEAVALVYNPWHVIFEANAPALVSAPAAGTTGKLDWETARASVKYSTASLGNVDVVIQKPELAYETFADNGVAVSDKAEFHLRQAPGQPQAVEGFLSIDGLMLGSDPDVLPALDGRLHVRIDGGSALLSGAGLARLVYASGGEVPIRVVLADVASEESRLGASGDLILSSDGTLSGTLDLTLSGKDAALDRIKQLVPADNSGFALVEGLFRSLQPTATDHNGDPAVQLPMVIDQGFMRIGFVPLGQIPPLFAPGS